MTGSRTPRRSGKVRAARLTDLAALGELSRLCQSDASRHALARPAGQRPADRRVQPVPAPAWRVPVPMTSCTSTRRTAAWPACCASSARRPATSGRSWNSMRSAWPTPGDIRYRLVQQLLREGAKRAAARFHVACADADGNVELLMQAGFIRFGEEIHPRPSGGGRMPKPWTDKIGPRRPGSDPLPSSMRCRCRGCTRLVSRHSRSTASRPSVSTTGSARGRTRGCRDPAWRPSCASRTSRRSSRRLRAMGQGRDRARRLPPDRGRQGGSAALPQDHRPSRSRHGPARRLRSRGHRGPDGKGDHRHDHGVFAPVRTYESPIDRRLEEAGFDSIASVTLLMKENLVRVAEPTLVPAGVR